MDSSDEPDMTGVMVIEPLGNAGPFLVQAAASLGIRLYAATDERVHAGYEPWLTRALDGVCLTRLADTARALDDMEAFCRAHSVTGVAVCWELLTPLAALLAARLGLPGNDPALAKAARNKIAMAEAFRAAGVPTPDQAVVTTAEQAHQVAASGRLGWPIVVKPAEQGGSWGVSVVAGPDGLDAAVAAAGRFTRAEPHGLPLDSRVLLQSYVPGEEFSADTVVHEGVPHPLPVVRKDTTAGRYRVETGHSCPAGLDAATVRTIQDTAARAALAVGIRNGVAHTEVKLPPCGAPVVIETGARLPGDNICELVEAATGVSEATAYLQAVTGRAPHTEPTRDTAAALRFVLPERAGVLEYVVIPEVPGTDSRVHIRPGERVPEPADSSGRVGHVLARAPSVGEARRLAAQVVTDTRVRVS